MKPTIKASIGGLAFNLEEDAFQKLDDYLQELKNHFEDNAESAEILTDIEQRISELLQMRINKTDGVVAVADVDSIIQIIGSPADFDTASEMEEDTTASSSEKNDRSKNKRKFDFQKKLFRDKDNALLGGVFSGLAHYFRIDQTIIRIVFVCISLLFLFSSHEEVFFGLILAYCILWIVMPQAKTFNEKLSMIGSSSSIENLEERGLNQRTYRGNSLKKIFKFVTQLILFLLIIVISLTIITTLICFIWLHFDTEILGVNNYLIFLGIDAIYSKLAVLAVVIIPLIGLLGLSVKLLRKSSFSIRTVIISVFGLICWMIAVVYLSNIGYRYAYIENISRNDTISLKTNADVLRIRLADAYANAEMQPFNSGMYYLESDKNRAVFWLPQVKIMTDTLLSEPFLEIQKTGLGRNKASIEKKLQQASLNYTLTDSLLIISPELYSMENPWKGVFFEVIVRMPVDKNVVVEEPLKENYNFDFE